MKIRCSSGTKFALLLVALACAGGPAQLRAQAERSEELNRAQMTEYTRAHMAMNTARDEFHGKLARVHDEEGRLRAREEIEASIESILEAHEMTREKYDEITLLISLDGEFRALFDEIIAELEEEGTAPG